MTTFKGRALLGWMSKDDAVRFLLEDCRFDRPMDRATAEAHWHGYRDRVLALPQRHFAIAAPVGVTPAEAGHAKRLALYLASIGHHDAMPARTVDLCELAVRQYMVVTDLAEEYAKTIGDTANWLNECLPLARANGTFGWRHQMRGMSAYIECDIPHGEWFFQPLGNGAFAPVEGLRHVTAMDGADRTYLWAGYHRSFAKVLTTPMANAPTALVLFARNVVVPAPAPGVPMLGVAMNAGIDDLGFFGSRGAKFGDFFTDGLYMDIDLRKKRYQLQVQATWVALDDPS